MIDNFLRSVSLVIAMIGCVACSSSYDADQVGHKFGPDPQAKGEIFSDANAPRIYIPANLNPLLIVSQIQNATEGSDSEDTAKIDYSQSVPYVEHEVASVLHANGFTIVSGAEMGPSIDSALHMADIHDKIAHIENDDLFKNEMVPFGIFELEIRVHEDYRPHPSDEESGSRKNLGAYLFTCNRYVRRQFYFPYYNHVAPYYQYSSPSAVYPARPDQTTNAEPEKEHYVQLTVSASIINPRTRQEFPAANEYPDSWSPRSIDYALGEAARKIAENFYTGNE